MKSARIIIALLLILAMATMVFAQAGTTTTRPAVHKDVIVVASSDSNLSTFVRLVRAAGLGRELMGRGPYTVFAPTNSAFAKLPKGTLDNLLKPENKAKLRALLLDHIVKGSMTSASLLKMKSPMTMSTLGGAKITLSHSGNTVMVDKARVTRSNVTASNGVIHEINMVLMPSK